MWRATVTRAVATGCRRNDFGTRHPALLLAPANLALGKQWQSAYVSTLPDAKIATNIADFKVVALEDIEVPAGRFRAFKIEGKGLGSQQRSQHVFTLKIWVDPATMHILRQDRYLIENRVTVLLNDSWLLASRKLAPR